MARMHRGGLWLALALLLASMQARAESAEDLLVQGEQAFLAGQLDEALELFGKAIEADDERWEGYYYSGMVLQTQQKTQPAIEMYEKALEIKPDATEPLNNLSVAYLEAGKLQKALDACTRALEADPEHYEAAYNIAVVLEEMGRTDEAVKAYLESAKLAPGDPEPYMDVAEIAFAAGDLAGAGKALAEAFERAPHQLELGLKALELLVDAGKDEQALALARKLAKRLGPKAAKNLESCLRVARSLRLLGDPAAALQLLQKIPGSKNLPFSVLTETGLCYLAMGQCKKASRAFDDALDVKPDSLAAKLARADALCCAHKWCKAKRAYKKFLKAAPADHVAVAAVKAKLAQGKKSCK